jgi:hypothetical protein
LLDYLLVDPSFSIYKTTLKSKSSINEVNQVAQVCIFSIHTIYITLNILLFVKLLTLLPYTIFLAEDHHKTKILQWCWAIVHCTTGTTNNKLLYCLYSGFVIGSQVYSIQICYHVLGLVHGIWTPVPQAVSYLLFVVFNVLL